MTWNDNSLGSRFKGKNRNIPFVVTWYSSGSETNSLIRIIVWVIETNNINDVYLYRPKSGINKKPLPFLTLLFTHTQKVLCQILISDVKNFSKAGNNESEWGRRALGPEMLGQDCHYFVYVVRQVLNLSEDGRSDVFCQMLLLVPRKMRTEDWALIWWEFDKRNCVVW